MTSRAPVSPALPPCSLDGVGIEGLYTGRFIALSWSDWVRRAAEAFAGDGGERLERIIRCATGPARPEEVERALADYRVLLAGAPGLLAEEVRHHNDLVATPLWAVQNAAGFLERLHLVQAQTLHRRPPAQLRLRKNLGHALRLHLLRRYLDRQIFAVVEVLWLLPALMDSPQPGWKLNNFEAAYGEEAGALAETIWRRLERHPDREREVKRMQAALLGCLDTRFLAEEDWLDLLELGLDLFDEALQRSRLVERFLKTIDDPAPSTPRRGIAIPWLALRYLVRVKRGGLGVILPLRAGLALLGSLRLAAGRLLRRDPYAVAGDPTAASLPALRTYREDGGGLIIDPAAVARGSARLNNPGIENLLALPTVGYAVDQYLLRKLAERWWDLDGVWSSRLEDFVRRWMGVGTTAWEEVEDSLAKISGLVDRAVELAASEEARRELSRGLLPRQMLEVFQRARRILLRRVAEEQQRESGTPLLFEMLHAYYMHGL